MASRIISLLQLLILLQATFASHLHPRHVLLSARDPLLPRQEYTCDGTDCGNGQCAPPGYECCSDGGASCPTGENCVPDGCCPTGEKCSGGGGTITDFGGIATDANQDASSVKYGGDFTDSDSFTDSDTFTGFDSFTNSFTAAASSTTVGGLATVTSSPTVGGSPGGGTAATGGASTPTPSTTGASGGNAGVGGAASGAGQGVESVRLSLVIGAVMALALMGIRAL